VQVPAETAASRGRILAASDEARRRIERDLDDGTQQRPVSRGLAVRAAEANAPPDSTDLRAELSRAKGAADAVEGRQEISRGIHPAIFSQRDLGPALQTPARHSVIPVELDIATNARFPAPVEVAAHFVVSEAMTKATKHAQASGIELSLATRNRSLVLSIDDDGVDGADPARGSGVVALPTASRLTVVRSLSAVAAGTGRTSRSSCRSSRMWERNREPPSVLLIDAIDSSEAW
jgi:signal transduction histidine kinase